MAIGFIEICINGCDGVEGKHIHAEEARTVDTVDEFRDVLIDSKFVRAALNAEAGGCVLGWRTDSNTFCCVFVFEGNFEPLHHFQSIDQACDWFVENNPRVFVKPVEANAPSSATIN